jgi:hypothetical protein
MAEMTGDWMAWAGSSSHVFLVDQELQFRGRFMPARFLLEPASPLLTAGGFRFTKVREKHRLFRAAFAAARCIRG